MTFSTICQVTGSMYVASAISGSVMIVAGFELTSTYAIAFLAQRLARLDARIIELARLTNDDRTRADYQNTFNVRALRHFVRRLPARHFFPSSVQSGRTTARYLAGRG